MKSLASFIFYQNFLMEIIQIQIFIENQMFSVI